MQDDTRTQLRRTYRIAGIFCTLFLLCSTFFLYNLSEQSNKDALRVLSNAAFQGSIALERQISGDFQTLTGVALSLGRLDVTQFDKIRPILQEINDKNAFIRMGLATPSGMIDWLDINGQTYEQVDLSKEAFFRRALEGENVISPLVRDPFGTGYISYCAVPIRQEGGIIGVLCAVNAESALRRLLEGSFFDNAPFFSIVNARGDNMFRMDTSPTPDSRSLSADLKDLKLPEDVYQRILDDLKKNIGGVIPVSTPEGARTVIYDPLGVADWSLLAVMSSSDVKQSNGRLMTAALSLTITALALFGFFLWRINSLAAKSRKELEVIAYCDLLTGARNYPKFLQDAGACLHNDPQGRYAIWQCDIKKFKYFNDIFGYDTGDAVLRQFAELLERDAAEREFSCRVSADNFTGIRPWEDPARQDRYFKNLLRALNERTAPLTNGFRLDLDVGVYDTGETREALSFNDMLNRATMALKSAKLAGGSQFSVFSEDMRSRVLWETELEASMHRALEDGEFQMYLQPKVNIRHGNRITGAEVLTRWLSPRRGMISPAEFIPLFEKNGFIIRMDRHIFEQACRWMRSWLDAGHPAINIAVNLSRLGLLQEDVIDFYAGVKERYGIPDDLLQLEITESIFLDNGALFRERVIELQKRGLLCSLDDFGAGYSSLNVLKNLPIDVLKLDILFFRQNSDGNRAQIVIRNIIAMAMELKMKTVAEGVEEPEQVEFLRSAGCDMVQGFVFARPMPVADFESLLAELNGRPIEYAIQ